MTRSPLTGSNVEIQRLRHDDAWLMAAVTALALSLDIRHRSPDERDTGSFLTLPPDFSVDTVRALSTQGGVVAMDASGALAGFMLASANAAMAPSPVLKAMKALIDDGRFGDRTWAVYGPVGIRPDSQGQGIAIRMFESLTEQMQSQTMHTNRPDLIVGFIDARNTPSLSVHEHKLGFDEIGRFDVDGTSYVAIAHDLRAGRTP